MKWNFYFTIIAMMIQIMLLQFFKHSRVLPLKKNRMFHDILTLSVITCIFNIISAYFDSIRGEHYGSFVIITSLIYYELFLYVFYKLFRYGMDYLGFDHIAEKHRNLHRFLLVIFFVWSLLSYWNHDLYYIDFYGDFCYGQYFDFFYAILLFYAATLAYYENKAKHNLLRSERLPLEVCVCVLVLGIICDKLSNTVILTDIFLSVCELTLYITLENPAFYTSDITDTYNTEAFVCLIDELIEKNSPYHIAGLRISNMHSLKKHHGSRNLYKTMKIVGAWFQETFPGTYVFFPDNDCFVLMSTKPIDAENILAQYKKRFINPFGRNDIKIFFRGYIFTFDNTAPYKSGSDIVSAMSNCKGSIDENGIHHIDDEDRKNIESDMEIEKILQKHIICQDIDVYYQPLFNTETKKIEGAEALARLIDPEFGVIPPGKFIPLAEKNGSIIELGLIIFEKVCAFASTCDLKQLGIRFLNVNLSTVQLQNQNLADSFEAIARKYGVDFSIFDFEITETGLTSDNMIETQINVLKSRGASVSLDDFGTGNSNLERLTHFPFSVSKLDMSLVWSYFSGKNLIMKDVINIFKNQDLKIVAEGVETREMVDTLSKMKCDYLQGYYFSKPLPKDEFIKFTEDFNKSSTEGL